MRQLVAALFAAGLSIPALHAQKSINYAVRMKAIASASPASIALSWPKDSTATAFKIWRKAVNATTWGTSPVADLPGTATKWTDVDVAKGGTYEYRIVESSKWGSTAVTAYGYMVAGIEAPAVEFRGNMILLVDETFATSLSKQITRLVNDIEADGWHVVTHNIKRTEEVTAVKDIIKNDYNTLPGNAKAVFLLGHIPVPYSGNIAIDGHNDHIGAWPADVYYGDLDGEWTDDVISNVTASRVQNQNDQFDGKFDQSVLPSDMELQVGRVDLYDMPAFSETEEELMKRYLDKDHRYRTRQFVAAERAVVEDNFGAMSGEAFAASGFKNFSVMFGPDNVMEEDYMTSIKSKSYLWSYGTGGGSYTNAGGIGSTADFAADSAQSVFNMLFGSYFGDWDVTNSFLRAPLAAKGYSLTNAWSGRPHWLFHHMALGANIGYSAWASQNQYGTLYFRSSILGPNDRLCSPALMGDPSLRLHMTDMASGLNVNYATADKSVSLNWSAPKSTPLGYHVYRMAPQDNGKWIRLNNEILSATSYKEASPKQGLIKYMVRPVYLTTSASGSYFNLSPGVMDTLTIKEGDTTQTFIAGVQDAHTLKIFPNPAVSHVLIDWKGVNGARSGVISLYDVAGREVRSQAAAGLTETQYIQVGLEGLAKGVYTLRLTRADSQPYTARIIKE